MDTHNHKRRHEKKRHTFKGLASAKGRSKVANNSKNTKVRIRFAELVAASTDMKIAIPNAIPNARAPLCQRSNPKAPIGSGTASSKSRSGVFDLLSIEGNSRLMQQKVNRGKKPQKFTAA